jgi:hypothetical protein
MPSKLSAHLRNPSSRARWALTASVALAAACANVPDAGEAIDDDFVESDADAGAELESKAAINVSTETARSIAASAPKNSAGLPLWESRPGARVALFLDFDGGRYNNEVSYRGIDLDGNRARFGSSEQAAIVRAALEVAEGYKGFDINVTTDEAAMRKASKWGWILITDDESSSGKAKIGVIERSSRCGSSSSCYPKGIAGSKAVFSPPSSQRGYLLIHELGHEFGLHHSGLYKNGTFYEWSDLEQSRTSDWMGGRNGYFSDYKWTRSQTEDSTSWQDPVKIIGSIAGTVSGGGTGGGTGGGSSGGGSSGCHTVPPNHSSYCTSSCPCNEGEGDCDNDSQCARGFVCQEGGTVDRCVRPADEDDCGRTAAVFRDNGGTGYGLCQGDCDRDTDCLPGLVCAQLNTGAAVPGCAGRSTNNTDYCVAPACM